ncbi:hypothetical protein K439DRAFT_1402132 [Ramaria rubella]|nr:hypothetical protein K439DRAFT_1402132 [Ramaria rubella]
MLTSSFVTLLSLAASALAITVTNPSQDVTWSTSGPNTVSWTEVSTDPTTFAVTLVSKRRTQVQLGVFKQTLADNVDGTKGSLTISASLPVGTGFQVNIVKSSQDMNTILAQSAQFNITQGTGSSSSAANSSAGTATSSSSSAGPSLNPSTTSGGSASSLG